MKYGRLLIRARRLSNPTWQDSWLDYHALKGIIYTIKDKKNNINKLESSDDDESTCTINTTETAKSNSDTHSLTTTVASASSSSSSSATGTTTQNILSSHRNTSNGHSLNNNKDAVDATNETTTTTTKLTAQQQNTLLSRTFFEKLRLELRKVSLFFNEQEKKLLSRTSNFAEELSAAESQIIDETDIEEKEARVITLSRLMESCKVLYVDLMMLENFAVMNYGGFAKILKKHDKNTEFITQERYLRKVVNIKPFALYEQLKSGIRLSETAFTRLVNMIPNEEPTANVATTKGTSISSASLASPNRQITSNDVEKISSLRQMSDIVRVASPIPKGTIDEINAMKKRKAKNNQSTETNGSKTEGSKIVREAWALKAAIESSESSNKNGNKRRKLSIEK